MRALVTTDAVGGVWTYALELARGLVRRDVDVHLAVLGPAPGGAARRAARDAGVTLHQGSFALEWMPDPWDDVDRGGQWLLALEERVRPDVVHLNQLAYGALPWRAPRLVAAHSCVGSWWRAVRGTPPPEAWDAYLRRVRASLQAADLVVAPTRAMLAVFRDLYGPLPNAVAIPNGRAPGGRAHPPTERMEVVLTAGRLWDDAKNVRALDRVAPHLPWPGLAAGSTRGPDGARVRLRHLRALGRLSEPALDAWLTRAAAFALPARYEPFGYGPLEAAQGGCALVLGDIPSLREVWGDAALYVDPNDPPALTAAICRLARDPAFRRTLAQRARRRAERYGVDRMVESYLAAYRRLSGTARGGAGPARRARGADAPSREGMSS